MACAALVAAHPAPAGACRPPLYEIQLQPFDASGAGSGTAHIEPAATPFGMALTPDGHVVYDVHITVANLPAATDMGGAQYVAWVTTPNLDRGERLGSIAADGTVQGQVTLNKFIILVTAERTPVGSHWTGRIVLRGFSPTSFLQNFSNEELFNGGMPPC